MSRHRTVPRGLTLIDLMVAIALLGIAGTIFPSLLEQRRARVIEGAQVERALQWLEYEADARVQKRAVDPLVVAQLREGLPDAALSVSPPEADRTATLRVDFRTATGRIKSVELKLAGVKP